MDLPGGTVNKNPPANVRDVGSIPGREGSHAWLQLGQYTMTTEAHTH